MGVQFHPEFNSQYGKPSPVFVGLVLASVGKLKQFLKQNKQFMEKIRQKNEEMKLEDEAELRALGYIE